MGMFIDPKAKIPVTLDGNTIYIRAKMSIAIKALVEDEIAAKGMGNREALEMRGMGSYALALLKHNIVAWEGPKFMQESGRPLPCIPANIELLDPDDPLVQLVREEIGERNAPKGTLEDADPN